MRAPAGWALLLALSACGAAKESTSGDAGSESAISQRADDIRNAAEADINRQISEIDEAANAEQAAIPLNSTATP
jgi:hypothetical protein